MAPEDFGNWADTTDDIDADDDAPTIYVADLPERWPPLSESWQHLQSAPANWDPTIPVVW